ncbi:MAG: hypothetical protein COY40_04775, partial [Alphaproteobacteria bacterium CG_4_10_14_0_8_um_filter_53_9]
MTEYAEKLLSPVKGNLRVALPSHEDDQKAPAHGDAGAMMLLSITLWVGAVLAAYGTYQTSVQTPAQIRERAIQPLRIAAAAPSLSVAPVVPHMATVVPGARAFVLEATQALARDEVESALLKLSLVERGVRVVASRWEGR